MSTMPSVFTTWLKQRAGQAKAAEARRLVGGTSRIEPITLSSVSLRAPRPRYCALSNAKLAATGYPMPTWQNAMHRWLGPRPAAGDPGSTRE